MKLYLIRHCKTKDLQNGVTQSDKSEIIVNETTAEMIADVRDRIRGKVDRAFCSPTVRTRQTAELLFGKGNYEVLDNTYEYYFGAML